jgi:hypothetical protein
MICKAISKTGSLGSCFVYVDIGYSSEQLAMQNFKILNYTKVALSTPLLRQK